MNIFTALFNILLAILIVFAQTSSNWDLLNLFEQFKQVEPNIIKPYQIINLPEAWQKLNSTITTISPLTIGVADSGIDIFHQEFEDINVISDSPDISLIVHAGHGTQVAGIIGANNISFDREYISPQMNGITTGLKNLKPQIIGKRVVNLKWIERFIPGVDKVSLINKLEKLATTNVNIVNMSVTESHNNVETFNAQKSLYEKIFNNHPKILFITGTNNDGLDTSKNLPAAIKLSNTITVAATDLNDQRAVFTSGSSGFGSFVDLSAPGMGVYAPAPGNKYDKNFQGTSASAPMVTGVAGLIKAIKGDAISATDIKKILMRTADPVFAPIGSDEVGKLLGSGCTATSTPSGMALRGCRLNAFKAVCDPLVLNCAPTPPPQLPAWPMFQKDAQRTGLSDVSGPPFATSTEVAVKWQRTISSAFFSFPLIGGDGMVYVPAVSSVFAFNGQTGEQKWQSANLGFLGGGALSPDSKTFYVCGMDGLTSILTALNTSDGSIKWRFNVGNFRICNNPAVGNDGTIYTSLPPAFNLQLNTAIAVNPAGTEKWRHEEGGTATTPPALSKDESQDYVSFRDRLTAFNAQTGQILWTQFGINFDIFILTDNEERVFVLDPDTSSGGISAFSKSGSFLWRQRLGGLSSANLLPNGNLAVFSHFASMFLLLNPSTGDIISSLPLPSPFPTGFGAPSPVADKDGILYIPFRSEPGKPHGLVAADIFGNTRWLFETPDVPSGAALGSDGTIYFTTRDTVYSLGR